MNNPVVYNPNDFKVVELHNATDFDFTPEMGCMYDSRPIFGISGTCIKAGEKLTLPYHVGNQLAKNLAKQALIKQAPAVDPAGVPTGVPLWNETALDEKKDKFMRVLYSTEKPVAQTETDKLMAQVAELSKMVSTLMSNGEKSPVTAPIVTPESTNSEDGNVPPTPPVATTYADKQDVIAELEKRGIKHDKRKGKDELEQLLKEEPKA